MENYNPYFTTMENNDPVDSERCYGGVVPRGLYLNSGDKYASSFIDRFQCRRKDAFKELSDLEILALSFFSPSCRSLMVLIIDICHYVALCQCVPIVCLCESSDLRYGDTPFYLLLVSSH